jgi:hypothetical protein
MEVNMQVSGSLKSIQALEDMLCSSFNHLVIKGNKHWQDDTAPKTYTKIIELYPDSGLFQHTVWLRFTYCTESNHAEMKVTNKDVQRFMQILEQRSIRLNGTAKEQGKAKIQRPYPVLGS